MQTEFSATNRKSAEYIKETNRRKHQINKDTDINGTPNIIDVSIDEDINNRMNNHNDESFVDDHNDFKQFATFQNINQKVTNLNMKGWYPRGNTLNEQQEERKAANNSSKINRHSTKRYHPIASRNKFRAIYTKLLDLKEDDAYTIDLQINNLVTQNTRKVYILVNSMTNGIRRNEFNLKLNKYSNRFRLFICVTLKQM